MGAGRSLFWGILMSLAATPPAALLAAQTVALERAGPPRRRRLQPKCVRDGRTSYPYVGDITEDGVEIYHHSSRQGLPVEWRELIHGGADLYGMSVPDFLDFLKQQAASQPSSGPSAPSSETEHGQPGGRTERR